MQENWVGLKYKEQNYSNLFEVSDFGNIRRIGYKNNLKQFVRKDGYKTIHLSLGSRKNCITIRLHKAILESFKGINKDKIEVNHIDFDRGNNKLYNLEWTTPKENVQHSIYNIRKSCKKRIENFNFKLKEKDILFIRENYIPRDKIFGSRALSRFFDIDHMVILKVIKRVGCYI